MPSMPRVCEYAVRKKGKKAPPNSAAVLIDSDDESPATPVAVDASSSLSSPPDSLHSPSPGGPSPPARKKLMLTLGWKYRDRDLKAEVAAIKAKIAVLELQKAALGVDMAIQKAKKTAHKVEKNSTREAEEEAGEHKQQERPRKRQKRAQQEHKKAKSSSDSQQGDEMEGDSSSEPQSDNEATAIGTQSRSGYYMVLATEEDCEIFSEALATYPSANLRGIRILEIHIDTATLTGSTEFLLAVALYAFRPSYTGANPHNLEALRVVVKGPFLLTRYHYHLSSPAASVHANPVLHALVNDQLSVKDTTALAYQLSSSERGVADALLALRGIRSVRIECPGKVEGNFAQTLVDTLTQPPRTNVVQLYEPTFPFIAEGMNRDGRIHSKAYGPIALQPYVARDTIQQSCSKGGLQQTPANRPRRGVAAEEMNKVTEDEPEEAGLEMAVMVRVRQTKSKVPVNSLDGDASLEFGWKVHKRW